ncbi:uncharacterized protein LOC116852593 [Odontomachus brunneus]|uniref:uncharacterized protein LOC116852593 n=1 Tax=Odontomachus brunneus TaxID=486640 RepID=UPI0013F20127|nr:uncharacterized protein LOC116852593 [Odontomachus brunneus]
MKRSIPEATRVTSSYFVDKVFENTEDGYNAALDYMAEVLEELEPPVSPNQSTDLSYTRASHSAYSLAHLPPIQMAPFDGNVAEWEHFRDRFSALIIGNKDLNDFAKMHFLVSFLRGRALECIANLSVTADNFAVAWNALRTRYDNRRRLLSVHLSILLNLPGLSRESVTELQALRGTITMTIASLNNLQRSSDDLWNDFLVHLVSQRLDPITRKAWNLRSSETDDPPLFPDLDRFIASRIRALEEFSTGTSSLLGGKTPSATRVHFAAASAPLRAPCPMCKAHHYFSACPTFMRGAPSQRRDLAKRHRRCFNCLSQNHSAQECQSKYSCRVCHQRHHSLLHADSDVSAHRVEASSAPERETASSFSGAEVHSLLVATIAQRSAPVLLATARVRLSSACGRSVAIWALLDQGSKITFISENVAQLLRLKRIRMPVSVSTVGSISAGLCRHAVELAISPRNSSSPSYTITALILRSLTSYTPERSVDASCLTQFSALSWADPDPCGKDPIDLILGADFYGEVLRDGICRSDGGGLVAQNTAFGWIISRPVRSIEHFESPSPLRAAVTLPRDSVSVLHCLGAPSLEDEIRQFWEIEELPRIPLRSPEDDKCEEHFVTTHSRSPDGRYIVRLPFKTDPPIDIGASHFRAERLLTSITHRLQTDPEHRHAYVDFMRAYEQLGHMQRANHATNSSSQVVFIPHHPVYRAHSSTTNLRVVFNASSPTSNGSSLNDHLFSGPKLQTELPAVILRWRAFKYVYSADIEKMYRQFQVDPRDIDYQRILWTDDPRVKPTEYQLLTITYGMCCAPYLALRVIQQLVVDDGDHFPLAIPILKNHVYVDDVLFGADYKRELIRIRDQLVSLLRRGRFELRKCPVIRLAFSTISTSKIRVSMLENACGQRRCQDSRHYVDNFG